MKKRLAIFLIISLLVSTIVYADVEIKNTTPIANLSASVVHNNNINIQVLTDFTGEKSASLTTKMNQFKADMFSYGKNINVHTYDGSTYIKNILDIDLNNKIAYVRAENVYGTNYETGSTMMELYTIGVYVGDDGCIYYDNGDGARRISSPPWGIYNPFRSNYSNRLTKYTQLSNIASIQYNYSKYIPYPLLAVKYDGTVWGFDVRNNNAPAQIEGISNAKWVQTFNFGYNYGSWWSNFGWTYFLDKNNTLWAMDNDSGLMGIGGDNIVGSPADNPRVTPTKILENVDKIFNLGLYNYVRTKDGKLWAWGFNLYDTDAVINNVTFYYNNGNGNVTQYGANLGLPITLNTGNISGIGKVLITRPTQIPQLNNVKYIHFFNGDYKSIDYTNADYFDVAVAITDNGDVYYWGYSKNSTLKLNNGSLLNLGGMTSTPIPVKINGLSNIKNIEFYSDLRNNTLFYLALNNNGDLYAAGHENTTKTNITGGVDSNTPILIDTNVDNIFTDVDANNILYPNDISMNQFTHDYSMSFYGQGNNYPYHVKPSDYVINSFNVRPKQKTLFKIKSDNTLYQVGRDYFINQDLFKTYNQNNSNVRYNTSFVEVNIPNDVGTYTGKYYNLTFVPRPIDGGGESYSVFYRRDNKDLYFYNQAFQYIVNGSQTQPELTTQSISLMNNNMGLVFIPNNSLLMNNSNNDDINIFIYISDGIGNMGGLGTYYGFGSLNSPLTYYFAENNYTIYTLSPLTNMNYLFPNLKTQNTTLNQLLSLSATGGKVYDSTTTGGLTQLDMLLNNLANTYKETSEPLYAETQYTKDADIMVLTDYTGQKLSDLTSSLNNMKANLFSNNVNMNYNINTDNEFSFRLYGTSNKTISTFSNTVMTVTNDGLLKINGIIKSGISDVVSASYSYDYYLALKKDGTLWGWGKNNQAGQIPAQDGEAFLDTPRMFPDLKDIVDFGQNYYCSYALDKNGNLYKMGVMYWQYYNASAYPTYSKAELLLTGVKSIYAQDLSFVALMNDGTIYAYGNNTDGQLADAPTVTRWDASNNMLLICSGSKIPGLTNIKKMWWKNESGIAIKNDGTVVKWGPNNQTSPIEVINNINGYDIQRVGFTRSSAYIIKKDGSIWELTLNYTDFNNATQKKYLLGSRNVKDPYSGETYTETYNIITLDNTIIDVDVDFTAHNVIFLTSDGIVYREYLKSNGLLYSLTFDSNINTYIDRYTDVYSVGINNFMKNSTLNNNTNKYFIYISDSTSSDFSKPYGQYYSFGNLNNEFKNFLVNNKFIIHSVSSPDYYDFIIKPPNIDIQRQELSIRQLVESSPSGKLYNIGQYQKALDDIVIDLLTLRDTPNPGYIALEDNLLYKKTYNDYERDTSNVNTPYAERWKYNHDPNVFENNTGYIDNNNIWSSWSSDFISQKKFNKVGKYLISYQAQDDPTLNELFNNYREGSKGENQLIVYVNRRPIADFEYNITGNNLAFYNTSYDLDHMSHENNGIVEYFYKYKKIDDTNWIINKPTTINTNDIYIVQLIVKDEDGFISNPCTKIVDATIPSIVINPKSQSWINTPINITITAIDNSTTGLKNLQYCITDSYLYPRISWVNKTYSTFTTTDTVNTLLNQEGEFYVHAKASNNKGGSAYTYGGVYQLDFTPPNIDVNPSPGNIPLGTLIGLSLSDNLSGVKETWYSISTSNSSIAGLSGFSKINTPSVTMPNTDGTYYLHIKCYDNAGNVNYQIYGPYIITSYKLLNFRVVLINDLHLEKYYKDATGKYVDKPIYVNDLAADENNFFVNGVSIGNPEFKKLSKGYSFEFEIDSVGLNDNADTIAITPTFYSYTAGVPAIRGPEADLYWEASDHTIYKAGQGGHSKYNTVILTKNERVITNAIAKEATWRGNYLIPGTSWLVNKGLVPTYKGQYSLNQDIIVNFNIKGYKNGVMVYDYNLTQWPKERTVIKSPYAIGDVIRYDYKMSNLDDINTIRNR